ncbi:MAG: anthranilate phosphoribosyltransferase [Alphaproteobacteria bacterium]|nr:anthranilate phosphoribosyltransferase [Alphaproteobacteria bacterium]
MGNSIQKYIDKASDFQDLEFAEAEHAFQIIMNGGATPAQMAAFMVAMRMKKETATEITAGASVMRAKAQKFICPQGAVDTCGTGGDARGTLNISTAVAIVVAACGVPVVKHGNRSVTSKSGSSDVLSELNVNVSAPIETMELALKRCNLAFLMAPRFHQAMRHVAPVRLELGMRSIFNLLGPLSNPAQPEFQVVGVYDRAWLTPLAEVLGRLGCKRAWVVHGSDGLDELTTTGESWVAELREDGTVREFSLHPEDVGLPQATLQSLAGKNPKFNAIRLQELLQGQNDAYRDIVLLNSAAVLVVAGKVTTLSEGVAMAAAAIDTRKARETLATLVSISKNDENLHAYWSQNE